MSARNGQERQRLARIGALLRALARTGALLRVSARDESVWVQSELGDEVRRAESARQDL